MEKRKIKNEEGKYEVLSKGKCNCSGGGNFPHENSCGWTVISTHDNPDDADDEIDYLDSDRDNQLDIQ